MDGSALSLTLQLPLPPLGCSPNFNKKSWQAKARAKADHQTDARLRAISGMRLLRAAGATYTFPLKRVEIEIVFYCGGLGTKVDKRYRPRDADNAIASCKGAIDGLAKAGLIAGDSRKCVTAVTVRILREKKEHKGRAGIDLTVREVAP